MSGDHLLPLTPDVSGQHGDHGDNGATPTCALGKYKHTPGPRGMWGRIFNIKINDHML